nr:hypothetical protein [Tanacetum cinerariifolium]
MREQHTITTTTLSKVWRGVISSYDDEALVKEDTFKHGRIDEIDADDDISLISTHDVVSTHDDVSTQDNIVQDEGIEDVGEEEVVEVVTTAKMLIDTIVDVAQVTTVVADILVSVAETIVTTAPTITAESTKTNVELVEESTKKAQAEITQKESLKRAGDKLEQERSKKQKGRIDEIDADKDIALVSTHDTQDNIVQDGGIEDVGEKEVVEVFTTAKMIIDAAQVTTAIADILVSVAETIVTTAPTITAESTKTNVEDFDLEVGINRNGIIVAAQAEGNANGNNEEWVILLGTAKSSHGEGMLYLQTQLLIAQKKEVGIQLQAKEIYLMVATADLNEIEEVNANYILMANLL